MQSLAAVAVMWPNDLCIEQDVFLYTHIYLRDLGGPLQPLGQEREPLSSRSRQVATRQRRLRYARNNCCWPSSLQIGA